MESTQILVYDFKRTQQYIRWSKTPIIKVERTVHEETLEEETRADIIGKIPDTFIHEGQKYKLIKI